MKKDELLAKKIIALEIIQTIIQHSDDNYLLRVALTQKLRDLLGCKLVVFINYNVFSKNNEILSIEYNPDSVESSQLKNDIHMIADELQSIQICQRFDNFHQELPSFKDLTHTVVLPITHQENLIGTILMFDMIQLYDISTVIEAIESLAPYMSIVLYNAISYHQMENIIKMRTAELKDAINQVNESSKAKSLFLANMSHEMRTPLNGIIGFVDLLLLVEEDQGKTEYLKKIQRASKSLLHLISEVLDFSKLEFDSIELFDAPFDPMQAIEDIISLHQDRALTKGIALRIQSKHFPKGTVYGDIERFNQILNNLISNSIKFTDEGYVELNVETEVVDIRIDDELIEQQLKLKCDVIDTGKGIHEENIDKIFGVFSQEDASTTRKYGGTGLGLAIVKKLIELMDGEIQVESTIGEGSVFSFYVYFGLKADEVQEVNTNSLDETVLDSNDIIPIQRSMEDLSLLVVEDNDINANLIGEILKLKSIQPDFAKNGQEALDLTENKEYDLILMDCQMPVMDGFSAAKEIRRRYQNPDVPYIIALTAAVSETDRKKCYESGMNDYLTKPINLDNIINRIDGFLKKQAI